MAMQVNVQEVGACDSGETGRSNAMARAIWSGSISFGLVNVPVKVYTAVRQKDIHFTQLDEKGDRILRTVSTGNFRIITRDCRTGTARRAEYHDLEGAFGRRAITERAKGILMERHSVDETMAFEMLREHSRASNRRLIDVAAAVVDGHRLLPKRAHTTSPRAQAGRGRAG